MLACLFWLPHLTTLCSYVCLLPDLSSLASLRMALAPQVTRATLKLLRNAGSLGPSLTLPPVCVMVLSELSWTCIPQPLILASPSNQGIQLTGEGQCRSTSHSCYHTPHVSYPTVPALTPPDSKSYTRSKQNSPSLPSAGWQKQTQINLPKMP